MRHYQYDDVRGEDDRKHFRNLRARAEKEWQRKQESDWDMFKDLSQLHEED